MTHSDRFPNILIGYAYLIGYSALAWLLIRFIYTLIGRFSA